ncbi:MAG: oligosaccharide flippase family protein [Rhodospirillales bacterium]|nr:oligosaccharide flippase family protein [Rhodospirillales bacterium]
MRLRANVMYVFVPQVFRAVLGLSVLPVTTMVLEASDFGVFAIYTVISNLFSGLVVSGLMYSISHELLKRKLEGKKKVITSLLVFSFCFSSLLVAVLYAFSHFLINIFDYELPGSALYSWVLVVSIFLVPVWIIASSIITVESRFPVFAVVSIAETVTSVGVTIFTLFVLGLGRDALFYGALTSAVTSFVGAIFFLRRWICYELDKHFMKAHLLVCLRSLPSSIVEKVRNPFQNLLFAKYVGTSFVGVFNHSQQYMNMTRMMVKAVTNALWKPALVEARDGGDFHFVLSCWSCMYFFLTILGVFFATVGRDVIGVLTNYKMVDAHWLAAVWMVVLLVENTGRAEVATIYDRGLVSASEIMLLISFGISLFLMAILIPSIGVAGSVIATLISPLAHRFMLIFYIRKLCNWRFREKRAIFGGLIVFASLGVSLQIDPTLLVSSLLFAFFLVLTFVVFRGEIFWGIRTLLPAHTGWLVSNK